MLYARALVLATAIMHFPEGLVVQPSAGRKPGAIPVGALAPGSINPLQAMADDPVYGRWKVKAQSKTPSSTPEPGSVALMEQGSQSDHAARTLIVDGCSGSSYMMGLAGKLMEGHGLSLHPVGEGGSHKSDLMKKMAGYLSDEELKRMEKLDMTAALKLSLRRVAARNQSMFFKVNSELKRWDPDFELMATLFQWQGVKAALVFRENLLDWNLCRVRDCFDGGARGYPVDKNGNRDAACFGRRSDPSRPTWALLKPQSLVTKMKLDAMDRAETFKRLHEKKLVWEEIYSEDLLSFERSAVGYKPSILAWRKLLKSWGLEPQNEIIRKVLEAEPLAGKLPEPGPHSQVIWNFDEVASELRKEGLEHYLRT
mmetsp:Transcript_70491/g.153097  ORF Transcript_70491/g.153097 Transcript_70491/m.153097 type:complete len:369 (+) Transcript_70491:86-1192(+)